MSTQQPARAHAPSRYTSAAITTGVVVAAVCFAVALLAEMAGADAGTGEMTDLAAVLAVLGISAVVAILR